MRDYILFAIVFGALPFILKRPSIGIVLWCWFSYMNPHRFAFGMAYSFPFAAVIAGATLAGLLLSREPRRLPWTSLTGLWLAFVLWMSLTTIFALVPDDAHEEWMRTIKIQIMGFVTIMTMHNRERLHALVWAIVVSLGFFGIKGGVFTLLTGGREMVWGPPDSMITGNNALALALVMTLPLMRYLHLNTQRRVVRLGLVGGMMLSALAILASYSRGAFLAVAVMGGYLLLKSRHKGAIVLVGLLAVPAMLSFMPEKWFERLSTIQSYDEDASALGRINAWWFAFNVAKDRPLTGGGYNVFDPDLFKRYAPEPEDFHDAHSIYFEVLGEHGFIGLALFLFLGLTTFRYGSWVIRNTEGRADLIWARDLAAMTQVSLVGYAVGGAFLGLAYFDLFYHLVGIMLLTRTFTARALAEPVSEPPAAEQAVSPAGHTGAGPA